jgi:hypothetical protein
MRDAYVIDNMHRPSSPARTFSNTIAPDIPWFGVNELLNGMNDIFGDDCVTSPKRILRAVLVRKGVWNSDSLESFGTRGVDVKARSYRTASGNAIMRFRRKAGIERWRIEEGKLPLPAHTDQPLPGASACPTATF